jgi:hypothetical protein
MEYINATNTINQLETFTHPWTQLPHIADDMVEMLIEGINSKQYTPSKVFYFLKKMDQYLNTTHLRTIHERCKALYENYGEWYLYDHALCSRVTDRWNLTPRYKAEGYYYCSLERAKKLEEPPYKWKAMQLDEPFF